MKISNINLINQIITFSFKKMESKIYFFSILVITSLAAYYLYKTLKKIKATKIEVQDKINNNSFLNTDLRRKKKYENKIKQTSKMYYKNIESLSEADVVLIGENHKNPTHHLLEGKIIREFSGDSDILILEGIDRKDLYSNLTSLCINYPVINSLFLIIKKNLKVNGWEKSLEACTQEHNFIKRKFLKLKNCVSGVDNDRKISILRQKISHLVQKRNQYVIESILENIENLNGNKIFLISGKGHIIYKDTDYNFNIFDYLPENLKCAAIVLD
ncbi:MAG: ChaN family lipoprotein [Parachlamydia sp.]|jgi:hypothetical protein|nr:ChaN family lipoprotein [Parachlamydia sp.]